MVAFPYNVEDMDGQIITPTQLLVEEMAITFEGKDDDNNQICVHMILNLEVNSWPKCMCYLAYPLM